MYRKVVKTAIIIVIITIASSCSKLRIAGTKDRALDMEMSSEKFMDGLEERNILKEAIAINKIMIRYEGGGERRNLRANMKTDGKGGILLSIRTFGGIEVARILVERDVVKVADRINRIYYTGNTEELAGKYGLRYDFINLLFGDFERIEISEKRLKCENGRLVLRDMVDEIEYSVDCKLMKVTGISGTTNEGRDGYKADFGEFREEEGLLYPAKILWTIADGETVLNIEMENLRKTEAKELIFNVGSNYKRKTIK